jgi:glycosyltransferase involved in cell wall biosynthesis
LIIHASLPEKITAFTLSIELETPGVKLAIVHEWLTTYAGSEKVLEAMLKEFPQADLFCLMDFLPERDRAWLSGHAPRTSFLQQVPAARRIYRYLLPLMPFAIEQYDLSDYDVVISNSHAVAKGVITGPDQLHICYCYTPMRYAWHLQHQYLEEAGFGGMRSLFARLALHQMRIWDYRTASGVDHFVACSHYIARRLTKAYRRTSTVIYPNVEVDDFDIGEERGDFYLTSSRMVPYKKIGLIVEAFAQMPDRRLVVIGTGPQFRQIRQSAPANVSVLGYQPPAVLRDHLKAARAFIFAAEEDFGIAPVEAQACGTPVLAYGRGGASETIVDGVTGLHFHAQTTEAICAVVDRFETMEDRFDPVQIRAHALNFSTQRFRDEFRRFVEARWAEHQQSLTAVAAGARQPRLRTAF